MPMTTISNPTGANGMPKTTGAEIVEDFVNSGATTLTVGMLVALTGDSTVAAAVTGTTSANACIGVVVATATPTGSASNHTVRVQTHGETTVNAAAGVVFGNELTQSATAGQAAVAGTGVATFGIALGSTSGGQVRVYVRPSHT